MRIFTSLAIASTILISACTNSFNKTNKEAALATPHRLHQYLCESGDTITASYPTTNKTIVTYKRNEIEMKIAVSASGSRYVSDKLEWWTKGIGSGSSATLLNHNANGTSGDTIEFCTAI